MTRREFIGSGAAFALWSGCKGLKLTKENLKMTTDRWANLDDAMVASSKKTIKELFAEDPSRAEKFSVEAAGWFLDYSKNRIDKTTMKALVKLAEDSNLCREWNDAT